MASPRHDRPCAGDPNGLMSRVLPIGMARTSPAMTAQGVIPGARSARREPLIKTHHVITGLVPVIPLL
jgi:hypothetical protein